jgi:hypothetical protein
MPRLWWTADGLLVEDGDPRAAVLAAGDADPAPEGDRAPALKSDAPVSDKMTKAPANK